MARGSTCLCVYLTTLRAAQSTRHQMIPVNNDLQRYGQQRSWANLRHYHDIRAGKLRKNTTTLSEDSRCPSRHVEEGRGRQPARPSAVPRVVLTSHRPSGVPSPSRRGPEDVVGPGGNGGREFSNDNLRTRLLELSLYSLSSSWTKCVSSSPGLMVTPQTGQQDGSDWNFFFPVKYKRTLQ